MRSSVMVRIATTPATSASVGVTYAGPSPPKLPLRFAGRCLERGERPVVRSSEVYEELLPTGECSWGTAGAVEWPFAPGEARVRRPAPEKRTVARVPRRKDPGDPEREDPSRGQFGRPLRPRSVIHRGRVHGVGGCIGRPPNLFTARRLECAQNLFVALAGEDEDPLALHHRARVSEPHGNPPLPLQRLRPPRWIAHRFGPAGYPPAPVRSPKPGPVLRGGARRDDESDGPEQQQDPGPRAGASQRGHWGSVRHRVLVGGAWLPRRDEGAYRVPPGGGGIFCHGLC